MVRAARCLTTVAARIIWRYKIGMSTAPPRPRGRPRVDSEAVNVRMERPMLDAIDAWIAQLPEPRPSRPDVVRDVMTAWMVRRGKA